MSDLFWPGDERAGDLLADATWLAAMVRVEQAWLDVLAEAGIAPSTSALSELVGAEDVEDLGRSSEAGGNPVAGLVTMLRWRSRNPWVHRGLTSQDVVDTALMLCLRDVLARIDDEVRAQVDALAGLTTAHLSAPMAGRTLTQHAVPITFGYKAAQWLSGVLDAADAVCGLWLPVQIGGAAGTLAAVTALVEGHSAQSAVRLVGATAERLDLRPAAPWHTNRRTVTSVGDALVACTDAWGRIATDVATLSRPEIAELAEPAAAGRGGSSTMPHKQNPVLSVLVRRAAITTPALASTLHLAAALAGDERPDGAWHAEWATVRTLGRRAVTAASQTTELVTGLHVDTARMAATVRANRADLTAERDAIRAFVGAEQEKGDYLGANDQLIDQVVARAVAFLERGT